MFTNDLDVSSVGKRIEQLGIARAQLSIDPQVAWSVVVDIRTAHGLPAPEPVKA